MKLAIVICDIAGFKITETVHYNDGIPTRAVFHIRTGEGNIIGRAFSNLVESSKLLADIRVTIT